MNDIVTLYGNIEKDDLPEPGTWAKVTMNNGMVAQVWNLRDGRSLPEMLSHTLHYVPVRTTSVKQYVVHAAINRREGGRNRWCETTICSRGGDTNRIVASILPGTLTDTVTCAQCRKQLVADGAIDQV